MDKDLLQFPRDTVGETTYKDKQSQLDILYSIEEQQCINDWWTQILYKNFYNILQIIINRTYGNYCNIVCVD